MQHVSIHFQNSRSENEKRSAAKEGHHESLSFANAATCLVRFVRSKGEPSLRDRQNQQLLDHSLRSQADQSRMVIPGSGLSLVSLFPSSLGTVNYVTSLYDAIFEARARKRTNDRSTPTDYVARECSIKNVILDAKRNFIFLNPKLGLKFFGILHFYVERYPKSLSFSPILHFLYFELKKFSISSFILFYFVIFFFDQNYLD